MALKKRTYRWHMNNWIFVVKIWKIGFNPLMFDLPKPDVLIRWRCRHWGRFRAASTMRTAGCRDRLFTDPWDYVVTIGNPPMCIPWSLAFQCCHSGRRMDCFGGWPSVVRDTDSGIRLKHYMSIFQNSGIAMEYSWDESSIAKIIRNIK